VRGDVNEVYLMAIIYLIMLKKQNILSFLNLIMDREYTRNKGHIMLASSISSVLSTFITNPIEVAKLNHQYFPVSCPQYPHQCNHFNTQLIFNSSTANAVSSASLALGKVSKWPFLKFFSAISSLCSFMNHPDNTLSTTPTLIAILRLLVLPSLLD
jgi:hypothetical protein